MPGRARGCWGQALALAALVCGLLMPRPALAGHPGQAKGVEWSPPESFACASGATKPSLAAGPGGAWHLVYRETQPAEAPNSYYYHICYKSDESEVEMLAQDVWPGGGLLAYPAVAADGEGGVCVVYPRTTDGQTYNLYLRSKTTGGWSGPVLVASGGGATEPDLALGAGGEWHLVYRETASVAGSPGYCIRYRNSAGETAVLAEATWPGTTLLAYPTIAADAQGGVHVVYPLTHGDGVYHLMYTVWEGDAWSGPVELAAATMAACPSLAARPDGGWHLVYRDAAPGGDTRIVYRSDRGDSATLAQGGALAYSSVDAAGDGWLRVVYAQSAGDNTYCLQQRAQSNAWTLMFYLDADNNLGSTYWPIFNQLEAGAANPNVRVVAVWDPPGNSGSAYFEVQPDSDLAHLAAYIPGADAWPKPELDMGASSTVVDFVDWARQRYPAQHYALVLSDHGSGLGGALWDETSGHHVTVAQLGEALTAATGGGERKIDVLYMDACLMGMIEDAYQVRGYVDYYVASENIQWSYAAPYRGYVAGVRPDTTPAALAALFTASYAAEGARARRPYTMSSVAMGGIGEVVSATNAFALALNAQMATVAVTLTESVLPVVQRFEMDGDGRIDADDSYVDLYDLARLVRQACGEGELAVTAQGVMDALVGYVAAEAHGSGPVGEECWNLDQAHGVSVFFPPTASSFYHAGNYDFAAGAAWPGASAPARASADAPAWGAMLVSYFQAAQPGGADDPTPPELLPRRKFQALFLPSVARP